MPDKWSQYEVQPAGADKWAQYAVSPNADKKLEGVGGYHVPPTGTLRKSTQRERFLNTYPVGVKDEGLLENLHNMAQNVGVGMFKTLAHPYDTIIKPAFDLLPTSIIIDSLSKKPNAIQTNIHGLYEGLTTRPGEVLPEMAGQAIATAGLGKGLGAAGDAIVGASPAKIIMQDLAGAGREPVELARQARAKRIETVKEGYNQKLADVQKENDLAQKAAQAKTIAERKEYIRQLAEHRQQKSIAETTAKAPDAVTKRQQGIADVARQNAITTFRATKASLDARWGQLRKTLGPMPMNKEPLAKAVQTAQDKYLMGAPDSIALFKQLTNQLEAQEGGGTAFLERPQGGASSVLTPQIGTMPWEQGRVFYTALGDKMYSGELPGNVRQAVGYVRDALDKELSSTAKAAGKDAEYSGVKRDWSQFKQDWDDMSNLNYAKHATGQSGSPLARLVRARTPDAALRVLTDERLPGQMQRYQKFGADINNPRQVMALESAKGKISKVKVPSAPAEVQATIAKLKEPPRAPKIPKELTPEEIRRRKLLEFAGRPYRPWDIVNPAHTLLKEDKVREAVAKQKRKEITP